MEEYLEMANNALNENNELKKENAALRAALEKIAKYSHPDKTCSLEAQGFDQVECAEIGAKDYLAGLAREALNL